MVPPTRRLFRLLFKHALRIVRVSHGTLEERQPVELKYSSPLSRDVRPLALEELV